MPKEPTCVSGSQSEAVNPLSRGCWDIRGIFLVVLVGGGVLMAVKCIGHPGTGIIPLKVPVRPPQCRLFYFEGQGKLPVEAKLEEQVGQT